MNSLECNDIFQIILLCPNKILKTLCSYHKTVKNFFSHLFLAHIFTLSLFLTLSPIRKITTQFNFWCLHYWGDKYTSWAGCHKSESSIQCPTMAEEEFVCIWFMVVMWTTGGFWTPIVVLVTIFVVITSLSSFHLSIDRRLAFIKKFPTVEGSKPSWRAMVTCISLLGRLVSCRTV